MKLHLDLLEQADHLSRRENKKPRQASLRRSTSGSYYALFHLLSAEMATIIAPNVHERGRAQIQRTLSHDTMKQVCAKFLQTPLSAPLTALTGTPVSDELRLVALAFVQLQDARHSADYDLNSNWNRAKARQYFQLARDAFHAWELIRKNAEANIFLLSFFLLKNFESPR